MNTRKYSGKKILVYEEFLQGIKAHNRKLVSDKNELIDKLIAAEEKIFSLNSELEKLKKNNDTNINQDLEESFTSNNHPKQKVEEYTEVNEIPLNTKKLNNSNEQKNITNANNFQTSNFSPYNVVYITPLENFIVEELLKEPQTYSQLSVKTGVKPENLRTHKKNLALKGVVIEDKKLHGSNHKLLYVNEDQFKRTKIQIKST